MVDCELFGFVVGVTCLGCWVLLFVWVVARCCLFGLLVVVFGWLLVVVFGWLLVGGFVCVVGCCCLFVLLGVVVCLCCWLMLFVLGLVDSGCFGC